MCHPESMIRRIITYEKQCTYRVRVRTRRTTQPRTANANAKRRCHFFRYLHIFRSVLRIQPPIDTKPNEIMRVSISLVALGGGLLITSSTSASSSSSSPNALGPFAFGRRRRVAGGGPHHLAFATVSSDVVDKAKNRVLSLASNIKSDSKTGVFISDPEVKSDLKRSVADLEAVSGSPTDRERQLMIGDWTLLCTTNSANGRGADIDGSSGSKKKGPKLPFKLPELPFQNELTKSIAVTQRIRCMDEDAVGDAKVIDRVDNIIQFTPFADTVGELLGDSMPFAALKDLTLNPLEVKKSKVTLVHKAEVQSLAPVLRTKINLQSYVRE